MFGECAEKMNHFIWLRNYKRNIIIWDISVENVITFLIFIVELNISMKSRAFQMYLWVMDNLQETDVTYLYGWKTKLDFRKVS